MKKKITVAARFAAVFAALCLTAAPLSAAAVGLNASEQALLERLQAGVQTRDGATYHLPARYLVQLKTYLSRSDVDLTEAAAAQATAVLNQAAAILARTDSGNLRGLLSDSEAGELLRSAKAAADENGLHLVYNYLPSGVAVKDADGRVILTTDDAIKTTGAATSGAVWAALLAILPIAVLRKKARATDARL